jgi:hypothetical protein
MLSAIVTSDSIDVLAERLAAWCIVVTGGDYFNFSFTTRADCLPSPPFSCLSSSVSLRAMP